MKKANYIIPQVKTCYLEPSPLMDQTNADVHTDDPQPPSGALGNNVFFDEDEDNVQKDKKLRLNVWE